MSGVLGFDTATAYATVAVLREGAPVGESSSGPDAAGRPRHAVSLLPEIERLVEGAGGWDSIERIGVGVGPGSFTGLRIGIATARALAQSLGKPLVPVGSLDVLARGMAESATEDELLLALLDARRSQVFAALFANGRRLWDPFVASAAEVLSRVAELERPPRCAGDGSVRFRDELEAASLPVADDDDESHRIRARYVCELAIERAPAEPQAVEPVYLRAPDAERWHERDRN
jgi:tRNA threonylcarbamoyladenosine biosynthesis protein TsaB